MSQTLTRIGLSMRLLILLALFASCGSSAQAGPCVEHVDCDDTLFCNGVEQCISLQCEPGTPIDCSGLNDDCNDGACAEGVDACVPQPANETGPCDDDLFCTVDDICTSGTCDGAPRDCSDGIACSTDTCDEGLDQCSSTAAPNCPDCSGDSVPDLCIAPQANDANWSNDIWDLPGGEYPDNIGHFPGLFVELLSPQSILLDTDVVIEGLDVRNGGTLRASQGAGADLTITTVPPSGIINKGTIYVANDTNISVLGGSFSISENGAYLAQPGIGVGTTASLTARDISVIFDGCGMTARMVVSERMTLTTTAGDLLLDGRGVLACASAGGNTASRGGKTPPILKISSTTAVSSRGQAASEGGGRPGQLNIAGSFVMLEGAEVCVGCDANANAVPPSIVLNGNFDNQSKLPSFFRWPSGELNFTAGGHTFEVAGLDLGANRQGFSTNADTTFDTDPHTNFSIAAITVANLGAVTFQNTFPNTAGTSLGDEALYVRNLTLELGSSVTIDGCTVYYCDLQNNGAAISFLNGGALLYADCGIPAVSTWGLLAMTGLLLCVGTVLVTRRTRRADA